MRRLLFVTALVLPACASGPESRATTTTAGTSRLSGASDASDPDMNCHQEVRTGTHLEKNICRSQVEKDQDKRNVQDMYLAPTARPGAR